MSDPDFDTDEENDDLVVLTDEEGKDHPFRLLALLDVEDGQFAMLVPVEEGDENEDTFDLFLMRYSEDADGVGHFGPIDDEALFAKVQAAAENLLDQSAEEDEPEN